MNGSMALGVVFHAPNENGQQLLDGLGGTEYITSRVS